MPPQDNDGVKFRTYKSTGSVGMPVNSGRHCHADIRHMQTCNLRHHPKPLDADIYPQQCKCRKQRTYKHNQNGCPSSCATFRKSPLMCNWPSCCWCIWSDCHRQCRHQSRSPFPICSMSVITHCQIRNRAISRRTHGRLVLQPLLLGPLPARSAVFMGLTSVWAILGDVVVMCKTSGGGPSSPLLLF